MPGYNMKGPGDFDPPDDDYEYPRGRLSEKDYEDDEKPMVMGRHVVAGRTIFEEDFAYDPLSRKGFE